MQYMFAGGLLTRVCLTAVFVVGVLVMSGRPAAACSVGPDWDRRAATERFVLGRIVAVELRPSQLFPPSKSTPPAYQKVVTMEVDLVLKGPTVKTVTFVDAGYASKEIAANGAETIFWGGGGDCGAIESDPRGRYAAFALGRWNGELYSSILLGSAFGADARDPGVMRLIEFHGLSLPATATEPGLPVGAVAGGLSSGAAFLWLVTRRIRMRRDEPTGLIG